MRGWLQRGDRSASPPEAPIDGVEAEGAPEAAIVARLGELVALRDCLPAGALLVRRHSPAGAPPLDGTQASRLAGRGLAFHGLRAYQPGDDRRHIDWRHTARRGRPYTKLFEAERECPVLLLVDQRAGMRFGTRGRFKSVQAARAAAVLAWAAAAAGDRVGGAVLAAGQPPLTPRAGESGVLALLAQLCRASAEPASGAAGDPPTLAGALAQAARLLRPGGELVVISDFADFDAAAEAALRRLAARNRVALLQLIDPFECSPPPPAVYRLTDGLRELEVDLRGEAARGAWGAALRERQARLLRFAGSATLSCRQLSTDGDPRQALALWLPSSPTAGGAGSLTGRPSPGSR